MWRRGIAIAALFAAACGEDDTGSPGTTGPGAPLVCEPGTGVEGDRCAPAGFEECQGGAGPDGAPCGELATCEPGTVAFFGRAECTPVGPVACPAGFSRDPSGIGCVPVMAKAECTGATRARLGSASCVPVGDCAAPFPPPAARYFVDDSFTPGQVDATHFTTIQEAVAAAPAGATIAIEEGTYSGTVTLPRAVTLAGRCAARVTLRGGDATTPGVDVAREIDVSVRGLTITSFEVGVSASAGAEVTLDALVLEGNRRLGVLAADPGTRVSAKGLAVRGTLPDASGRFGHGVAAGFESDVSVEDSAITSSGEMGAGAQRDARLTLARSIVAGVSQRAGNRAYGWGVGAQTGGQVTVRESAVLDTFGGGVVAAAATSGEGAIAVQVERSYIADVRPGPDSSGGSLASCVVAQGRVDMEVTGTTCARPALTGFFANRGAELTVTSSVVRGVVGDPDEAIGGVIGVSSSRLIVTRTAVVDSGVGGIIANGRLEASDVYVANVRGVGIAVQGSATVAGAVVSDVGRSIDSAQNNASASIVALDGGSLDARDVIVRRAEALGVLATASGKVSLQRAAITDMRSADDDGGIAVVAAEGAELTLTDAAIARASDAAVVVTGSGSVASLRGVSIVDTQASRGDGRAYALNVQNGGALNLSRVLTRGGAEAGLAVLEAETRAIVDGSVFEGVRSTALGFGHGVGVSRGGALVMSRSIVRDNASVGLVFSSASGSVASSVVRGNAVGVHVQEGVALVESSEAPAELTPLSVTFTTDTRFEENGSKVGSGEVPVPAPLEGFGP